MAFEIENESGKAFWVLKKGNGKVYAERLKIEVNEFLMEVDPEEEPVLRRISDNGFLGYLSESQVVVLKKNGFRLEPASPEIINNFFIKAKK